MPSGAVPGTKDGCVGDAKSENMGVSAENVVTDDIMGDPGTSVSPAEDAGLCGGDTPAESRRVRRGAFAGAPPSCATESCIAVSSGKSPGLGFESLGSRPSLQALRIRLAFHLAYTIFCIVSLPGLPQALTRPKKVAAASNVFAVVLDC